MDISRKRETYGITNINSTNAGDGTSNQVTTLRRTTSYVDDQDYIFVGLQDVVQKLLAQLLKAEPRRSVLSIHGMGGLGKTTLARKLYTSPDILNSFHTRAWICVSQEYNTMDLLRNIIKSVQGCTKETLDLFERMTEGDLEIYLRDLLKERKYLMVVDDVWQREAWESLKRAFPDGKNGSRVIITTRKEDVTERADDIGFVHKLRFLSQEESWDLFCRKLLNVRSMVPEMESLAKDMVEKCRGLPLAIVVLSRLLSHKKGLNEWQKLQKLMLGGKIEKLPDLFPNSITMMVLRESVLKEDPMPILGMLPNLRNLYLVAAYGGEEIMCSDNNFSQLEFLILGDLEKLETWHLGTSAMPLIKGLGIYDCPNLKEIPERMKDVELLKRNYNKW
ncbi:hypothetical protein MTR67_016730 [Solanum verrucosum]|uniref:NB-ARC domain-containing protein n=1 Tax=Solanum verrucosum TaxID=315347 RepID=A0AAF0QJ72_SOLVR|nr:hypothetical protein MTR67_016730 [Solanum verrucosum]